MPRVPSGVQRAAGGVAVLALFLALAALAVPPVLRDPAGAVVGNIEHSGLRGELFHQWDFLANVEAGRIGRYYDSERIAYPQGQDLREYIGFSLHLFFYVPLMALPGLVLRYNALILAALALNGFCAYLLGRRLTRAFWPSLVCGVLFFLSPYALLKVEMGFLQKVILWWLPLFVLHLLQFLDRERKGYAVLAGAVWAAMLLTYAPYAWYALLAGAIIVSCAWVAQPSRLGRLLARGWPALVPAVVAAAFLAWLIPRAGTFPEQAEPGYEPLAVAAAPGGCLDLLRAARCFPYRGLLEQVAALPVGISMVGTALAVVAVVRRRPGSLPLALVAVFFLIVSVGPYPHTNGRLLAPVPLPYRFLACRVPWGDRLGFPIRALAFFDLAVAALAALALGGWGPRARYSRTLRRGAVLFALAALILVFLERILLQPELFPPVTRSAALPPALRWLRERGGVVLHLPVNVRGPDCRHYCYITARTDTRMLNRYLDAEGGFPVPPLPDPLAASMARYLERLRHIGCDRIAVHTGLLALPVDPRTSPPCAAAEVYSPADTEVFQTWCGAPAYRDGALTVYTVPAVEAVRAVYQAQGASGPSREQDLLLQEARRRGLGREPEIVARVEAFRDRLAVERLLARELPADSDLDEEALRAYYEGHRDEFRRELQIRVLHGYVPAAPDAPDEVRRAAESEARRLQEQLRGEPERAFEQIAARSRQDPEGRRWGDLGYFSRGRFPGPVDEQLFAMTEIGETALIETADGFHVFRLMDIRPGREFTFEEVREAVRERAGRAAREQATAAFVLALRERGARPPDDMVYIPGGNFWAGSTEEEIDETVEMARRFVGRTCDVQRAWFEDETYRFLRVSPFYMDRREVTRDEYMAFVAATGHRPPPEWAFEVMDDGRKPVVGISWDDACAYAEWAGKRLPTAEEWEWAARGRARRRFPWGDEPPDGSRANYADAGTTFPWNDPEHDDGYPRLAPVGSYPAGATPEGLLDMAGNAREWTATACLGVINRADERIWSFSQRHRVPQGRRSAPVVMYRVQGGAWENAADDMRAADVRMAPPDMQRNSQGFRCARDAVPPTR